MEDKLLSVRNALYHATAAMGRSSTVTGGSKREVAVESTGEADFFEWMTNSFERRDGSITFLKRDTEATLKELKFTEAYLVKHREHFDASGEKPLTESFTISARKLEMGTGAYENEWV